MPIDIQVVDWGHTPKSKAAWAATGVIERADAEWRAHKSFDEVMELRRSPSVIREVSLDCVLGFVGHVFRTREGGQGEKLGLARKPLISAGALHPIEVLVVAGPEVKEPILLSERNSKWLTLPVRCPDRLASSVADTREILPTANGHLLLFAGDRGRVAEKYRPAESLLWRDAGAALQACAMAAFAYGYAFCPLGDTGRAILEQLHPPHEEFVAVGLGVFGQVETAKEAPARVQRTR